MPAIQYQKLANALQHEYHLMKDLKQHWSPELANEFADCNKYDPGPQEDLIKILKQEMPMTEYKVGDVVQLKIGGPKMLVYEASHYGTFINCYYWGKDNTLLTCSLKPECVIKVEYQVEFEKA